MSLKTVKNSRESPSNSRSLLGTLNLTSFRRKYGQRPFQSHTGRDQSTACQLKVDRPHCAQCKERFPVAKRTGAVKPRRQKTEKPP